MLKIKSNQNIINDIFKGYRFGNFMIVTRRKKLKNTKITFHYRISIFYTISETVNLT